MEKVLILSEEDTKNVTLSMYGMSIRHVKIKPMVADWLTKVP